MLTSHGLVQRDNAKQFRETGGVGHPEGEHLHLSEGLPCSIQGTGATSGRAIVQQGVSALCKSRNNPACARRGNRVGRDRDWKGGTRTEEA